MITHLLPVEIVAALGTLAATNAQLAALGRFAGQTGNPDRTPPLLVVHAIPRRSYRGGSAAMVSMTLTVESMANGDDTAADPDNHLSRVALVHSLFNGDDGKAAIIAAVAANGKLTIDDFGQVPEGIPEAVTDTTGDKLRSIFTFLVVARIPPPAS